MPNITKTELKKMSAKIKALFKTNKLKNYFRFKDLVPKNLCSNYIYKFLRRSFTDSYITKTYRHMKVRVSEHWCVLSRTGKPFTSQFCFVSLYYKKIK